MQKINQFELENNQLKSKINDLNVIIQVKSDEIIDLLKQQQRNGSNQLNINKLEIENKSLINENDMLKSELNNLNDVLKVKSDEIVNLKLKLNKYESKSELETYSSQNEDETSQDNQSEQTILILEPESSYKMSVCESETDSDQSDDETNNKVII